MKNYNPMSLFDNRRSVFNTPEEKQVEYLTRIRELQKLRKQLDDLWKKQRKEIA